MKMLFVGDVSPTMVSNPLFAAVDMPTLFNDVPALFAGCDCSFVNLECALTEAERPIEKFGPPLKAHRNTARALKELGVHICGLSNNHIFDYGIRGAKDTLAALEEEGLLYTGFGENEADSRRDLIVEHGGMRVAILAVCEHEYSYALPDRMGSRPYDPYDTMADVRRAAACCDRVVVVYHGGKEFCQYPSPRLYKLCHALVDNGADLVLCQHSHCIGCYEEYAGGHILYGQGNFHFVKADLVSPSIREIWSSSLALSYDAKQNTVFFTPLVETKAGGIEVAKGERGRKLLSDFAQRSRSLQDGTWREGFHAFCLSMEKTYRDAALSVGTTEEENLHREKLFGHYLDCEAHTDVWRELFPTANATNEKG